MVDKAIDFLNLFFFLTVRFCQSLWQRTFLNASWQNETPETCLKTGQVMWFFPSQWTILGGSSCEITKKLQYIPGTYA